MFDLHSATLSFLKSVFFNINVLFILSVICLTSISSIPKHSFWLFCLCLSINISFFELKINLLYLCHALMFELVDKEDYRVFYF